MPTKKPIKYKRGLPIRPSKSAEVKYRKVLLSIVNQINAAIKAQVLPVVRQNKGVTINDSTKIRDGYMGDIAQAFAIIQTMLNLDEQANGFIGASFVGVVGKEAENRINTSLDRIGFQLPTMQNIVEKEQIGNALDALTAENTNLITNMGEDYLRKMQRAITDDFLTGKFTGKGGLEKELSKISGVAKNRAKLIARDQVSKINAATVKIRSTNSGSIGYQWHNVKDQRVRGNPAGLYPNAKYSHWDRENKYYLWKPMSNPPPAPNGKPFRQPPPDGAPSEAINCRCYAQSIWIVEDEFLGA